MNINLFKFLYLTFFCIFVLFDYLVRTNVFGETFKLYYLKFVGSNILLVSLTLFVLIYAIFYITGAFDFLPSIIADLNSFFRNMVDSNFTDESSVAPAGVVGQRPSNATHLEHLAKEEACRRLCKGEGISSSNLLSQHLVDSSGSETQSAAKPQISSLYPNYPLNLLHDINTLINSELIMVVILINLFIVQYILTLEYTKYIPDNKFGRLVKIFLSRYIKVYSQSSKLIVGLCVLNLIVCIFFSKLFLYFIMNPY